MRTLIIATAFLAAAAAQAEPKHSARDTSKPVAAKSAAPAQTFEPRLIELKPIEMVAPALEIETREVSTAALDKKLASRANNTKSMEERTLREPSKAPASDAAAATNAPTAAAIKP